MALHGRQRRALTSVGVIVARGELIHGPARGFAARGLVVAPDGRSYGYSWHRAISDLYLVEGWS